MNEAYYHWLVSLIGDEYITVNYQKLLWKLYSVAYIWELDYDQCRAADGLYLRRDFIRETGCQLFDIDGSRWPCSVLEMMVALARKAEEDIMYDPDMGDRTRTWFWTMLSNLGLDIYDDYNWYEDEVDRILDVFLHRRYASNGSGGPFPVHLQNIDLRSTDLWMQMNKYLEESYPM